MLALNHLNHTKINPNIYHFFCISAYSGCVNLFATLSFKYL